MAAYCYTLYMRIGVFSSDGTIIFMVFSIVILNREINFQYTRGVYISYITYSAVY